MRPPIVTPDPTENGTEGEALRGAMASVVATLQHIENLHARARKLEALRIVAEEQLVQRIGTAYRAGELAGSDLAAIQERYRRLDVTGMATRWNAAVPEKWNDLAYEARMGRRHAPNGPEGTWAGSWPPAPEDRQPRLGTAVVYVLFDSANEPIYVGSTGRFLHRLKAHVRDGKPFVAWQACPAASREAAYRIEDRVLNEHLPSMNKKRGR
jgi:hypothetical protein